MENKYVYYVYYSWDEEEWTLWVSSLEENIAVPIYLSVKKMFPFHKIVKSPNIDKDESDHAWKTGEPVEI